MSKLIRLRIVAEAAGAARLLDSATYVTQTHRAPRAAHLVLNNSFIKREGLTTRKSPYHLCLPVSPTPAVLQTAKCSIGKPGSQHNDDQWIDHRVVPVSLAVNVREQRGQLGKLVFSLIGALDKTLPADAAVSHRDIKALGTGSHREVEARGKLPAGRRVEATCRQQRS